LRHFESFGSTQQNTFTLPGAFDRIVTDCWVLKTAGKDWLHGTRYIRFGFNRD
jgi:hypothetical protein